MRVRPHRGDRGPDRLDGGQVTPAERCAAAAAIVQRTTREQGYTVAVTDPGVLQAVAAMVASRQVEGSGDAKVA